MSKAEKFIQENTKGYSNQLEWSMKTQDKEVSCFHYWLTPDDARRAVGIAREETLLEVATWINDTFIFSKQAKEDFSQTFNIMKELL